MAGAIDGQVQYCNIDSQVSTFAIIDTEHCVPFESLSTSDNAELLQKLNSGFKNQYLLRLLDWSKFSGSK